MRTNLIGIIRQYLEIESNYAIIINGNYGIGKTHFFKKSLSSEIQEMCTPKDARKKYIPIHISLFGINSLEEIQTQIFCSIYPILKKKGLKLAAGFARSIIRGIAALKNLGTLDDYLSDFDLSANDWISYDEVVICFDDIDRKSDSLSIKDLFGFINTLVETHGAKIILIANEDILQKEQNYYLLKEKIIGVSIDFRADIEEAFESIIKERYASSSKVYFQFLKLQRELIISATIKNHCNLRSLIYFLEHFRVIFSSLTILFKSDKEFRRSEEEKFKSVLALSIGIAFEFKAGQLNSTNYQEFLSNPLLLPGIGLFLQNRSTDEKIEIKKTYTEEFKERYFENSDYYFFDSIFSYLIGHEPFNVSKLRAELDAIYNKDGELSEELQVFNKLKYLGCYELSYNEYRALTKKMLGFVDTGSYELELYPMIFHFATRFDNVLRLNIRNLKERFKIGISKGLNRYTSGDYLHFRFSVDERVEFAEEIKEMISFCQGIVERIKADKALTDYKNLLKLLENNLKGFLTVAQNKNEHFRYEPFFINISLGKMYSIIYHFTNKDLIEFGFYLQDRYRPIVSDRLLTEKEFLIHLKDRINLPKSRKIKNIRNVCLDFLVEKIDESILNFNR